MFSIIRIFKVHNKYIYRFIKINSGACWNNYIAKWMDSYDITVSFIVSQHKVYFILLYYNLQLHKCIIQMNLVAYNDLVDIFPGIKKVYKCVYIFFYSSSVQEK
jgi:hypothetical protein